MEAPCWGSEGADTHATSHPRLSKGKPGWGGGTRAACATQEFPSELSVSHRASSLLPPPLGGLALELRVRDED